MITKLKIDSTAESSKVLGIEFENKSSNLIILKRSTHPKVNKNGKQ